MYAKTVADLLVPGDDEAKQNDDGSEVKEAPNAYVGDMPVYCCSRTDFDRPEDAPIAEDTDGKCGGSKKTRFSSLASLISFGLQCKSCQRFQARIPERDRIKQTREAAESAVSTLQQKSNDIITEEMVNKATQQLTLLAKPTLKQEETEVFLSLLTTPFLAVPLLVEFFADGRARALQDPELQTCLELALYQLHPFHPLVDEVTTASAAAMLCSERDVVLDSRYGALLHEMLHSADAIFGGLSRLLSEAAHLAEATRDVFLFAVRLAVSLEEFAQAADSLAESAGNVVAANDNDDETAGGGVSTGGGIRRSPRSGDVNGRLFAGEARAQLLEYLGGSAADQIRHWLSETRHEDVMMQLELHVHLALIAASQIGAARASRASHERKREAGERGGSGRRRGGDANGSASSGDQARMKPSAPGVSAGEYDTILEAFLVSSAFVISWVDKTAATGRIARYPHVLRTIFAAVQSNAADVARWSIHPAHAAARDRVLSRMKAVVVSRAGLDSPIVPSSAAASSGANGDGGGWVPHSAHVTLCRTVLSSPTPALADSDVFEAISFPGTSCISISFDDRTRFASSRNSKGGSLFDWVRFYKDDAKIECWRDKDGSAMFQSGRPLPGQLGVPPLVIGADRVIVHFHTAKHMRRPVTRFEIAFVAPVDEAAVSRLEREMSGKGEGGRPVSRLACAKALALVANDLGSARMYLTTHVERLEDEAERESAALARRAGLFKADSTLVNLQSAEVLENASALQVVSTSMRTTDGFERVFGRRTTDFCSNLYESSECAIIQIRRDDVTYDVKRWGRLEPLSTEQVCVDSKHASAVVVVVCRKPRTSQKRANHRRSLQTRTHSSSRARSKHLRRLWATMMTTLISWGLAMTTAVVATPTRGTRR